MSVYSKRKNFPLLLNVVVTLSLAVMYIISLTMSHGEVSLNSYGEGYYEFLGFLIIGIYGLADLIKKET